MARADLRTEVRHRLSRDSSARAGHLSHVRRRGRAVLRRQGAQSQAAAGPVPNGAPDIGQGVPEIVPHGPLQGAIGRIATHPGARGRAMRTDEKRYPSAAARSRSENPGVGGSIPSLPTSLSATGWARRSLQISLLLVLLAWPRGNLVAQTPQARILDLSHDSQVLDEER